MKNRVYIFRDITLFFILIDERQRKRNVMYSCDYYSNVYQYVHFVLNLRYVQMCTVIYNVPQNLCGIVA